MIRAALNSTIKECRAPTGISIDRWQSRVIDNESIGGTLRGAGLVTLVAIGRGGRYGNKVVEVDSRWFSCIWCGL
ncbi:hypothetical protein BHM03_00049238 [Ensete ventricosum]|nr:hypothetical protein BHM03_00049238 [Ensete ventricosum]